MMLLILHSKVVYATINDEFLYKRYSSASYDYAKKISYSGNLMTNVNLLKDDTYKSYLKHVYGEVVKDLKSDFVFLEFLKLAKTSKILDVPESGYPTPNHLSLIIAEWQNSGVSFISMPKFISIYNEDQNSVHRWILLQGIPFYTLSASEAELTLDFLLKSLLQKDFVEIGDIIYDENDATVAAQNPYDKMLLADIAGYALSRFINWPEGDLLKKNRIPYEQKEKLRSKLHSLLLNKYKFNINDGSYDKNLLKKDIDAVFGTNQGVGVMMQSNMPIIESSFYPTTNSQNVSHEKAKLESTKSWSLWYLACAGALVIALFSWFLSKRR